MPELAEVQTVRDVLKKKILHKKILNIEVFYNNIVENDINDFKKALINDEFIDIKRKGKYLIFETNNYYMISHLRMEGKYFIKDLGDPIIKHEHIIFYFKDFTLRYHDTRKFGRMKIISKNEIVEYFKNLGPDANDVKDINLVYDKIIKSNLPIKTILLDQSIMAGLGNIYVNEVLYDSKINPYMLGKNITINDVKNIVNSSKKILDMAINNKGTTIRSYTSSLGVTGNYQNYLKVHMQSICECGEKIEKVKIGGRTTYYCPKCQK